MLHLLEAKVRRELAYGNMLSFGKHTLNFPFGKSVGTLKEDEKWLLSEGDQELPRHRAR